MLEILTVIAIILANIFFWSCLRCTSKHIEAEHNKGYQKRHYHGYREGLKKGLEEGEYLFRKNTINFLSKED